MRRRADPAPQGAGREPAPQAVARPAGLAAHPRDAAPGERAVPPQGQAQPPARHWRAEAGAAGRVQDRAGQPARQGRRRQAPDVEDGGGGAEARAGPAQLCQGEAGPAAGDARRGERAAEGHGLPGARRPGWRWAAARVHGLEPWLFPGETVEFDELVVLFLEMARLCNAVSVRLTVAW